MSLRPLLRPLLSLSRTRLPHSPSPTLFHSRKHLHTSPPLSDRSFTNLLASDIPPPVQVASISSEGIRLADGLLIGGACVFLEGKVFLWDVPVGGNATTTTKGKGGGKWEGWGEGQFELFDVVVPKPEILLLGTGKSISQPPAHLRAYLNKLGIQLDVMDTRNACSTYNLLSEEGRRVAAALLPWTPRAWERGETMVGAGARGGQGG